MNKRKIWLVILAVIVIAAIFAGIYFTQKPSQKEQVIKIGAILPLTGTAAEIAEQHKMGIDFAVNEINEKGGIKGKKLEIIYEDDRNDPKQTVNAFNKLTDIDKVQIVITVMSSPSMAVYPLAEKKRVVLFANCGHPEITTLSDWVFRNFPTSKHEARKMVKFAIENLKIRTMSVLFINDAFGVGAMEVIKQEFEKYGGKILAVEPFEKDQVDFKSQIIKILNSKPEAIYIYGYGKANGLVVKQVREMGWKGHILGSYNFSIEPTLSIAKDALEGTYFTVPAFDPDGTEERVKHFVEKFYERYKKIPLWNTVYEYDAVNMLAEIISKNEYSGEAIRRGLKTLGNFTGLAGRYSAFPNGEWESELVVKTFKNGVQVLVEK